LETVAHGRYSRRFNRLPVRRPIARDTVGSALAEQMSSFSCMRFKAYAGLVLMVDRGSGLAGHPTAVVPDAMLEMTTEPIPTTASAPTEIRSRTTAPLPMKVRSPMLLQPARVADGPMWTPSPIVQSCSTQAHELMMLANPTRAPLLITAFGPTKVPGPIKALGEITARGCLTV